MNIIRRKRMILVFILITGTLVATALVLYALKQNINLFYTPTEVSEKIAPHSRTIRVGGMVKEGSIQRGENLDIQFIITDYHKELPVSYTGILPDLFREGQGVVMLGQLSEQSEGVFQAQEVLAKHDENYMPPEVKEALDKASKKEKL